MWLVASADCIGQAGGLDGGSWPAVHAEQLLAELERHLVWGSLHIRTRA